MKLQATTRILWYEAELIYRYFVDYINRSDISLNVKRMEPVGDFRRLCDTVDQLELLILCDKPQKMFELLRRCPAIAESFSQTKETLHVQLVHSLPPRAEFHVLVPDVATPSFYGITAQFHTTTESDFGLKYWRTTGSSEHLRQMESRLTQPIPLDKTAEETDVFQTMGFPWIPPELREGRREIDWAVADSLPHLITAQDLKGDLHCHTDWTDGVDTPKDMLLEAQRKGLEFIALTDHSQRVAQCNGLTGKQLLHQWKIYEKLQTELDEESQAAGLPPIRLLKGVEVDILESAVLDIEDEVLEQADWVVASLHFGHTQPKRQLTKRLLVAIENPNVCVIAHPTGRFLPGHDPFDADWEQVFAAAAQHGCFLEINSHPKRLDLNDVHCMRAKELGVKLVISSDAHSKEALYVTRYGVNQARRAGLQADDVVNTKTWPEVMKLCRKK